LFVLLIKMQSNALLYESNIPIEIDKVIQIETRNIFVFIKMLHTPMKLENI